MKVYKLTDHDGKTRKETQWGPGISHTANGQPCQPLCSDGWIHFYTNPLIAIFMNPAHADFKSPILWEAETSGEELHETLKSGCKTLTTIKEIPLPLVSSTQKIVLGILCAKEIYNGGAWNEWADKWLEDKDRTKESAQATATSTYDFAIKIECASSAYYAALSAADKDFFSSYDAARAVVASNINSNIDFLNLIEKAMTYK